MQAGPSCLAKFQVKVKNCQNSLDMLFFFVSMVGIVENDGSTFVVGLFFFFFFGSGLWDLLKGIDYVSFVYL